MDKIKENLIIKNGISVLKYGVIKEIELEDWLTRMRVHDLEKPRIKKRILDQFNILELKT